MTERGERFSAPKENCQPDIEVRAIRLNHSFIEIVADTPQQNCKARPVRVQAEMKWMRNHF
jgi:hypothetical protein